MFEDKYNLTLEQNIFLAKKLIVENIYYSARLEGCNVTFPDTKTILDGVSVANLKMSDVEVILNLRDAWKYLIDNIEKTFDLDFACKINYFVARNESLEWGVLRNGNVSISGVDYVPSIPNKQDVIDDINEILSIENVTERAIRYFLWGMRNQLFWDGNKRTSILCANKILISEGKGILSIPEKHIREFNIRLTEFYNTNEYSKIDSFIYDNCIHGLVLKQEQAREGEEELEI
ncbi:Fic family protein [Xylanivirga thermophila]|uniref:Fic family protein n=1 Tax=Xylanivirga thermophila TaxID=2496273 RepID=UPI00101DED1A|nr:Fic family protein [Xylanivirga thermophila]